MENNISPAKKIITNILAVTAFLLLVGAMALYLRTGGDGAAGSTNPDTSAPQINEGTPSVSSFTDVAIGAESVRVIAPSEYLVVGKSMTLSIEIQPAGAPFGALVWSSADPEIASVDQSGTVTANARGSTYITVRTDDGLSDFVPVSVIDKAVIYLSPSAESKREYPVGDTNESAQSMKISEYCSEKLVLAGIDVHICGDESLSIKGRAKDARDKGANYYIAIHTANTEDDGAQVAFNRRVSDSIRMSLYIKDRLASIIPTENKGTVVSGVNLGIKELEHPEDYDIPAVFVEAQSHKKAENAQWIIDNSRFIGYAVADGIMDFLLGDVD